MSIFSPNSSKHISQSHTQQNPFPSNKEVKCRPSKMQWIHLSNGNENRKISTGSTDESEVQTLNTPLNQSSDLHLPRHAIRHTECVCRVSVYTNHSSLTAMKWCCPAVNEVQVFQIAFKRYLQKTDINTVSLMFITAYPQWIRSSSAPLLVSLLFCFHPFFLSPFPSFFSSFFVKRSG